MDFDLEPVPLPPDEHIPVSQAQRVFRKFGGPARLTHLLRAVGRNYAFSSVFRWDYPKTKGGRGGVVPSQAWNDIFKAARLEGLIITPEDLDPRQVFMDKKRILAFPPIVRKRKGKPAIE